MLKHSLRLAAALLTLAIAATTADAQRPQLGISGGATMPAGDVGDTQNTGYNVNLALQFRPPLLPFGVRAEGMWNELGGDDSLVGDLADFRVIGGTANLLYELPFVVVRPYLIGGAGVYNTKLDVAGVDSRTNFGLNGGVGIRFPLTGMDTYVEARFHNVFNALPGDNSAQLVPITFGILF
ncbi:MAG TPA: outer membrane beta-barrel protein [Gemmatimonadaceae bacterium]|nr:outer membrane beta-barrel protein [Gemmatimonadaceae bacterium]